MKNGAFGVHDILVGYALAHTVHALRHTSGSLIQINLHLTYTNNIRIEYFCKLKVVSIY